MRNIKVKVSLLEINLLTNTTHKYLILNILIIINNVKATNSNQHVHNIKI